MLAFERGRVELLEAAAAEQLMLRDRPGLKKIDGLQRKFDFLRVCSGMKTSCVSAMADLDPTGILYLGTDSGTFCFIMALTKNAT